jgi:light-regulated signal transduction histidine kinase (bacteriophytochrome)
VRVEARRDGKEWVVSCCDGDTVIERQHAERVCAMFQRLHPKETLR